MIVLLPLSRQRTAVRAALNARPCFRADGTGIRTDGAGAASRTRATSRTGGQHRPLRRAQPRVGPCHPCSVVPRSVVKERSAGRRLTQPALSAGIYRLIEGAARIGDEPAVG